jgi:hypothetical protein
MTERKKGLKKLGILAVVSIACILGSFYLGRRSISSQKQNIVKEAVEKVEAIVESPPAVKAVTANPRAGVYQSKTIRLDLNEDKTYKIKITTFGGDVEQSGRWKIRNSGMLMLINDSGNYKTYNITDDEVFIGENLVPKIK